MGLRPPSEKLVAADTIALLQRLEHTRCRSSLKRGACVCVVCAMWLSCWVCCLISAGPVPANPAGGPVELPSIEECLQLFKETYALDQWNVAHATMIQRKMLGAVLLVYLVVWSLLYGFV